MQRLLILIMFIPLMLFVSVGAKAHDDSNAPSYLKGGLVETPFELPSAEVLPDIDQALPIDEYVSTSKFAASHGSCMQNHLTSVQPSTLSCRGPPPSY
ncbi:hypothetical protein DN730_01990 [Marinomonas piezotolerans]|uniref:Uncharacterized protein n=1 Tax=Marinomonas piezotolerans TaxID=2213058 RepID=A0A370UDH5_9GAMM|nr:hypothetical protein [Marinomonas piezotolerans]RDL45842.1 hypothetical protein DN730_01990 [Marinomonas piezotolerans]